MEKHKPSLKDCLLGGPGLDGYAYKADTYCVDCGQEIIRELYPTWDGSEDTDYWPAPIFFGESDTAQHCAKCGEHLYGNDMSTSEDIEGKE